MKRIAVIQGPYKERDAMHFAARTWPIFLSVCLVSEACSAEITFRDLCMCDMLRAERCPQPCQQIVSLDARAKWTASRFLYACVCVADISFLKFVKLTSAS